MKKNTLKVIGLEDYEIVVYQALVKKGTSFITDIVKVTNLHRPQVYRAIHILEKKQLVTVGKLGKRKVYTAANPEKLELLFNTIEKDFFSHIEDLHQDFEKSQKDKPILTFSDGKEAIHDSYLDIARTLKKDERYYRYTSSVAMHREKYVPRGYYEGRDKKGLERWILASKAAFKNKPRLGRQVKMIPPEFDLFEHGIGQVIYGDKVGIVDYESESVITIEHAKFAEFQKQVFKLLFSKL